MVTNHPQILVDRQAFLSGRIDGLDLVKAVFEDTLGKELDTITRVGLHRFYECFLMVLGQMRADTEAQMGRTMPDIQRLDDEEGRGE